MEANSNKKQIIIALLSVAAFPVVFLYTNNIEEVLFSEMLFALLTFAFIPILLYGVLIALKQDTNKNVFALLLSTFIIQNFALFEKAFQFLLPSLKYWHVVIIFISSIIFFFFVREPKTQFLHYKEVFSIVSLVFSVLIVVNIAFSIPQAITKIKASLDRPVEDSTTQVVTARENMPNVYYLLFDEAASFNQLKSYYGYDSKELLAFLDKFRFANSITSRNIDAGTQAVMTNILNLDYVTKDFKSTVEDSALREKSLLFEYFINNGYKIDFISESSFYHGESVVANIESNKKSESISGESFLRLLINQTVFYPVRFETTNSNLPDSLLLPIEYMLDEDNIQTTPTLVWFHIGLPHQPFLVDERGNRIPTHQGNNWKDKKYYLDQYIYSTKIMKEIIEIIVSNDPDSVIILQSDHGARASSDDDIWEKEITFEDATQILNAVYYRGEPLSEIDGLSGINTMRVVINKLFDENLKKVEDRHGPEV